MDLGQSGHGVHVAEFDSGGWDYFIITSFFRTNFHRKIRLPPFLPSLPWYGV